MKTNRMVGVVGACLCLALGSVVCAQPRKAPLMEPGQLLQAFGSLRPAEGRVERGDPAAGRLGARAFDVTLLKPKGTSVDQPAEATVLEGEPVGNGRDATGPVLMLTRGVAVARGWRPIIRTVRTTTVAPGSALAVQIDGRMHRVFLLESSVASVWLNRNPGEVIDLRERQYVEIEGDDEKYDFVRDGAGAVVVYEMDQGAAGRDLMAEFPEHTAR